MFRAQIKEEIKKIVGEDVVFSVERPENQEHGDYSSNVALILATRLDSRQARQEKEGKNPKEMAEELKNKLLSNPIAKWVERIDIAGPGFLNFWISREGKLSVLEKALKEVDKFGKSNLLKNKKVIIEFTDPNPFKEFHIGHLMSNSIGESLARIIEFNGAEVKRAIYQGDVGLHVAKAMWAMTNVNEMQEIDLLNGKSYLKHNKAYENNEKEKKEIIEINKKLYNGSDKKLLNLYDKYRERSLSYFNAVYGLLGMRVRKKQYSNLSFFLKKQYFDLSFFESETGLIGKKIVEKGLEKGVFEKSDGAVVFRGEKFGLHTRVFINSDGLPTYETKELGLAELKNNKFKHDISLVITGNEIKEYFKVALAAMKELGMDASKIKHVPHGMLRLPSGKMSSRTGEVIPAEFLWGQVKERLRKRFEQSGKISGNKKENILNMVTLGAIKYSILKHSIGSDIIFDFGKSLALEGDSGPYIQYVYARTNSVLKKAKEAGLTMSLDNPPETMGGPEAILIHFPDIVEFAYENLNSNIIIRYLQELAGAFNAFYEKQQIIGVPESAYYVALTKAVSIVIKNGLNLLGISSPEKM